MRLYEGSLRIDTYCLPAKNAKTLDISIKEGRGQFALLFTVDVPDDEIAKAQAKKYLYNLSQQIDNALMELEK